jgi:choline-sulfatase
VTFRAAFCNTPQCSAARSALLTGLEPNRTGVVTNVDGGSLGKPLPASMPTIGTLFKKDGYSTGYFGKWHLGDRGPDQFGFTTASAGKDDAVAANAAAWIGQQTTPWLAWVSILNPHDIYFPPDGFGAVPIRPGVRPPFSGVENLKGKPQDQQEYAARTSANFRNKEDWLHYRSYYLNLVEKVDANLGTVLGAVQDLGATIIAYTTDHGDGLGEHGLPFKGPFMYEELLHIPLVISGPKELVEWGERDDLVYQADLVPTLCAMARIPVPKDLSGIDLMSKRNARDAVFLEYVGQQKKVYPIRTIRSHRWKLNAYDSGPRELYDLKADPHELKNLAGAPQVRETQSEFEQRLDNWRPPITELERRSPGRYLLKR